MPWLHKFIINLELFNWKLELQIETRNMKFLQRIPSWLKNKYLLTGNGVYGWIFFLMTGIL